MRVKFFPVSLLSFLLTVLLVACAQLAPPIAPSSQPSAVNPSAQPATLLVAAAASLQKALEEITPLYTQTNPNQTINYNFAASGALQQQIEQGAPVDVFISAAEKQMKTLQEKGLLVAETQKDLLTNQLVLITPNSIPGSVTDFRQLVKPEVKRIAIGEPRSVPVGQYATEVFKNLGILAQVQAKFVFGNNVKAVLTATETGEVDAGIVYFTDAKGSDKVMVAATADRQLHSPIRYPIAVLKSSKLLDASKRFVEFLQSDLAKAVFEKYGFGIIKP